MRNANLLSTDNRLRHRENQIEIFFQISQILFATNSSEICGRLIQTVVIDISNFSRQKKSFQFIMKSELFLSLTFALSLGLYAGSCILSNNWFPMISFLPALASMFCAVMFANSNDVDSKIFSDTWLFILIGCQASMSALPPVFFHFEKLSAIAFIVQMVGGLWTGLGLIAYVTSAPHKEATA